MKELPAAVWLLAGWLSLLLVAISLIFATIDGVVAMFLIPIAMLVGGVSGLGTKATARYGLLAVLLGAALVFLMTHYVVSTGFEAPSSASLADAFAFIAIPLTLSIGMLIWGVNLRRRNAAK